MHTFLFYFLFLISVCESNHTSLHRLSAVLFRFYVKWQYICVFISLLFSGDFGWFIIKGLAQ